jgi:hypothetical protein
MLAVLRFTFTKDLKFVVRHSPLAKATFEYSWLMIVQNLAWQSLQALQLCPRRALPCALGCPPRYITFRRGGPYSSRVHFPTWIKHVRADDYIRDGQHQKLPQWTELVQDRRRSQESFDCTDVAPAIAEC